MIRYPRFALCACLWLALGATAAAAPAPHSASTGALPAEALTLPSDTQLLMGVDVSALARSPFYKRFAQPGAALRPTALDTLQHDCQLDPERDLDQVVVARGPKGELAILALGRFDRKKLEAAWRQRAATAMAFTLAFPSERALVIGRTSWIGATAPTRLAARSALVSLTGQLPQRATFWLVGTGDALTLLTSGNGQSQPSATLPLGLPPLKSIVISGDVEPQVTVSALAEAPDERAARGLADMLQGFVALAALQSQRKPVLKDLASAISVKAEGARVRLEARLSDDMLDALLPRPAANPPASGAAPAH